MNRLASPGPSTPARTVSEDGASTIQPSEFEAIRSHLTDAELDRNGAGQLPYEPRGTETGPSQPGKMVSWKESDNIGLSRPFSSES